MTRFRWFAAVALAAASFGLVPPAGAVDTFTAPLALNLTEPDAFAVRPGEANTVYLAQKTGVVRRLKIAANGTVTLDPVVVLNLGDRISTTAERGLHGITFGPFGGKFYASYSTKAGASRLAEYPFGNGVANKAKERVLLEDAHASSHHYAGGIAFGPDKLLYMALGDAQLGDPAQNLNSLKGKIIRINPKASATKPYTIPAGNPFIGVAGARPEIWHLGFRNPWKWSFDKSTGAQWIADVGENTLEEVDMVAAGFKGGNFGWNKREGSLPFNGGAKPPGAIDPFYEYPHDATNCSITGGYVYRGTLFPALVGDYVFTDYCGGEVKALTPSKSIVDLGVTIDHPVSFGQDQNGELWILSISGGVYRLLPG